MELASCLPLLKINYIISCCQYILNSHIASNNSSFFWFPQTIANRLPYMTWNHSIPFVFFQTIASQMCCNPLIECHGIVIIECHGSVITECHGNVILECYGIVIIECHDIEIIECHGIVIRREYYSCCVLGGGRGLHLLHLTAKSRIDCESLK